MDLRWKTVGVIMRRCRAFFLGGQSLCPMGKGCARLEVSHMGATLVRPGFGCPCLSCLSCLSLQCHHLL